MLLSFDWFDETAVNLFVDTATKRLSVLLRLWSRRVLLLVRVDSIYGGEISRPTQMFHTTRYEKAKTQTKLRTTHAHTNEQSGSMEGHLFHTH